MKRGCSECGRPIARSNAKTCSARCRSARSRRIKRQRRSAGQAAANPEYVDTIASAVRSGTKDIAHEVMHETIQPLVRESMTEDVLHAIKAMVGMAPDVVARLGEDVNSDDPVIRQRAIDVWMRYTIGNKSVAPPGVEEDKQRPMVVNFEMPRPNTTAAEAVEKAEAEAVIDAVLEAKTCDMCGEVREEFVGQSSRCTQCYDAFREEVEGRFGEE